MVENKEVDESWGLTLVICRDSLGRYLLVKETKDRGWNIPCGKIELGEDPVTAAKREILEEAGIEVELKGFINISKAGLKPTAARIKPWFYAEPIGDGTIKKQKDKHSDEAGWFTYTEILSLKEGKPGFRFQDVLDWIEYVEMGGAIYPLPLLAHEGSKPTLVTWDEVAELQKRVPNAQKMMKAFEEKDWDTIFSMSFEKVPSTWNFDENKNNLLQAAMIYDGADVFRYVALNTRETKWDYGYKNSKGETIIELLEKEGFDKQFITQLQAV